MKPARRPEAPPRPWDPAIGAAFVLLWIAGGISAILAAPDIVSGGLFLLTLAGPVAAWILARRSGRPGIARGVLVTALFLLGLFVVLAGVFIHGMANLHFG